MTTELRFKASNKTALADAYNISLYTLQKWLKPFLNDIGEYRGVYTPKQVGIIIEHLGYPEKLEHISV